MFITLLLAIPVLFTSWILYQLFVVPWLSPLRDLPGPDKPKGFLGLNGHLPSVLKSAHIHII